jgi:vanillate O-demethylase monooxygenase subunit
MNLSTPTIYRCFQNSVELEASAGRQIEGFLDVGHFAFVHVETFGDRTNPEVPTYAVTPTANGFQADGTR